MPAQGTVNFSAVVSHGGVATNSAIPQSLPVVFSLPAIVHPTVPALPSASVSPLPAHYPTPSPAHVALSAGSSPHPQLGQVPPTMEQQGRASHEPPSFILQSGCVLYEI